MVLQQSEDYKPEKTTADWGEKCGAGCILSESSHNSPQELSAGVGVASPRATSEG